jgi:hypothetical protein
LSVEEIVMTADKPAEGTPEPARGPASYFPSTEKKYGPSIAEWKELIRASPLTKPGELVGWLKAEYGLGHGHANALVADTLAERKQPGEY